MASNKCGVTALLCGLSLGVLGMTSANAALVAQYSLEESGAGLADGATLADSSGSGNNATLSGSGATSVPGVVGNGIDFGSSYGTTGIGVAPVGTSARTIDTFFNPLSNGGQRGQNALFGYGATTAGEYFQLTYENGDQGHGLFIRHFGGAIQYGDNLNLMGDWHHVAVRVNPGATDFTGVDVFLDGALLSVAGTVGGGTGQALNTGSSALAFGSSINNPGNNLFNGSLDEFRIHDNALSNGEIAAQAAIPVPSVALLGAFGLLALVRRKRC